MELTHIFVAMVPAIIGLIATIIHDRIDKMKIANEETIKKFDEMARSLEQIDWDKPLRTVKLSDHSNRCRCAYCDTLNDHETGVCDRCGAPLL